MTYKTNYHHLVLQAGEIVLQGDTKVLSDKLQEVMAVIIFYSGKGDLGLV